MEQQFVVVLTIVQSEDPSIILRFLTLGFLHHGTYVMQPFINGEA